METQGAKTSAVDLYDDILDRHMHTPFGLVELGKKKEAIQSCQIMIESDRYRGAGNLVGALTDYSTRFGDGGRLNSQGHVRHWPSAISQTPETSKGQRCRVLGDEMAHVCFCQCLLLVACMHEQPDGSRLGPGPWRGLGSSLQAEAR